MFNPQRHSFWPSSRKAFAVGKGLKVANQRLVAISTGIDV